MPPAAVWQFWKDNLFPVDTITHSPGAFFDRILHSTHAKVPTEYVMRVLLALEPFLLKNDCTLDVFVERLYSAKFLGGNLVPYSKIARMWSPFFGKIPKRMDFRHGFLRVIQWTCRITSRSCRIDIVKQKKTGDSFQDVLLFTLDNTFSKTLPPFDCDIWIGYRVKTQPVVIGLSEYESVKSLCDARPISEIVPESAVCYQNETVEIGGLIGLRFTFREYLEKNEINLKKYQIGLDSEVVEMQDDYFCPIRKRVVLHKGCAYGAPVHLFQIDYSKSKSRGSAGKIASFTMKMVEREQSLLRHIDSLHSEFLKQIHPAFAFHFSVNEQMMFVNGRYLTRNVPAKILSKILQEYSQHGTVEFERKIFLTDEDIVSDRKNPNLERRFELLKSALTAKCPSVSFERPQRGIIRFVPLGSITFSQN